MAFSVNSIPQTITGSDPRPGFYGQSSKAWHSDLLKQSQDHFQRTGDNVPVVKLDAATIRYTPEGTIQPGQLSEEAITNALAYAQQDIKDYAAPGQDGLTLQQVGNIYKQPFIKGMQRLLNQYKAVEQDPTPGVKEQALAQTQAKFNELEQLSDQAQKQAANFFASVDVKDANGQSDGKITADEIAAKTLFDDTASQMFDSNQASYQQIINALQTNPSLNNDPNARYEGPSFEELKNNINTIQQKPWAAHQPLAQDGQISTGEREISQNLESVPLVTNQVVSSIHRKLDLKNRLNALSPQLGAPPLQPPA